MKKTLLLLLLILSFQLKAQWSSFGDSIRDGYMIGFESYKDQLLIYGLPQNYFYEWDGTDWQKFSPSLPSTTSGIHHAKVIDTILYVAPYARSGTNHLYFMHNGTWDSLPGTFRNAGSAYSPSLYNISAFQGNIYVCGSFNRVDNIVANAVAMWDGTKWSALGSGLETSISPYGSSAHGMAIYNDQLILAGDFRTAGGIAASGIAAWDGNKWSPFGQGFKNSALGVCAYRNELYACGEFEGSDTTALGFFGKWNGKAWVNPGFGFYGTNAYVHSLKVIDDVLYIAGNYNQMYDGKVEYHKCHSICRYNGQKVDTLDGGLNGPCEGIYKYKDKILIGGQFTYAGKIKTNHVAQLDAPIPSRILGLKKENLRIYPTLCENFLKVENKTGVKLNYILTSVEGRRIQEGIVENQIEVVALSSGLYIISVFSEGISYQGKFIKK